MNYRDKFEQYLKDEFRPGPYKKIQKERLELNSVKHYMLMIDYVAVDLVGFNDNGISIQTIESYFAINDINILKTLLERLEHRSLFVVRKFRVRRDMITTFNNYITFMTRFTT